MPNAELLGAVTETLRRNGGKMMEAQLHKALQSKGRDLSLFDLRRALLVLELNGVVRVQSLDEDRKLVTLVGVK
jgi:Fe2+ or Zn2+ uptake regulation protein